MSFLFDGEVRSNDIIEKQKWTNLSSDSIASKLNSHSKVNNSKVKQVIFLENSEKIFKPKKMAAKAWWRTRVTRSSQSMKQLIIIDEVLQLEPRLSFTTSKLKFHHHKRKKQEKTKENSSVLTWLIIIFHLVLKIHN